MKTVKIMLAVLTAVVLSTALCACGTKTKNTELGSINETSTQNGYHGDNSSNSSSAASDSKEKESAASTESTKPSRKDDLKVSNQTADFISAKNGDVLVSGDVILTINGFSFNIKDDYTTVIRPGLEKMGIDMNAAEAAGAIVFKNKDGYSRQVSINVQETDGVKHLELIAYAIPSKGSEKDAAYEDSIMQLNGYKPSEASELAAQLGVGKNGKVFVGDKSTYLIIREGTFNVSLNN